MASFVQFTVDDTSPTISYSPFRDTFSTPNLSAGWNPYYNISGFVHSIGEVGNGTSLHITSQNGASLALQWRGTGIQLRGNATLASYSVTVDGEPVSSPAPTDGNILANISGLEDGTHNITLTAQIPPGKLSNPSMLVFDDAVILSPLPVSSTVSFRLQTLEDNEIAFLGHWTYETDSSGASFHKSNTVGDRATVTFNGTTFLLQGITSPDAGNYTVTLDNVTTLLSGRSSFTTYDSLLFFSSGLDPNTTHSVDIRNLGSGELSLLADGFRTYAPVNLAQTSAVPTPLRATSNTSFGKGTIAAFVLAGILAFVLLTGCMFFFLCYRPQIRRRQSGNTNRRIDESPKEQEAGVVLDIVSDTGGHFTKHLDLEEEVGHEDHRSGMSGFARWKREAVRGDFSGVGLPLNFRHSDSTGEKTRHQGQPSSGGSDPLDSDSSAKKKARAKSKGKARQTTGRSWSPSFALDLPIRRWRQSGASPRMKSLSTGGVSTFVAAAPSLEGPGYQEPPSYAASISNLDSIQNSHSYASSGVPPPSPVNASRPYSHHRENSHGFIVHEGEPSFEYPGHHLFEPPQLRDAIPMRPLTRYDSGSPGDVLQTLSPRTSEVAYYQPQRRHTVLESSDVECPGKPSQMLLPTPTSGGYDDDSDSERVEVKDGIFLSVREISPFRVDFDSRSKSSSRILTGTNNAFVDTADPIGVSGGNVTSQRSSTSNSPKRSRVSAPPRIPEFVQGTSRTPVRFTFGIPYVPAPKQSSSGHSDGVTSFLDFTNSREGSMRSRSIRTVPGSEMERTLDEKYLFVRGDREPKSRWSNTTVPSIDSNPTAPANDSSGESQKLSRSTGSSTFPIQVHVTIPSSPHHIMDDAPRTTRLSRGSGLTSNDVHVHPALENLESPIDSIPMSVSEVEFRNASDSEDRTTEHSPAHPPLPGHSAGDEFQIRPFDPSILVSRVLGMNSPTSMGSLRPGHSRSASATAVPQSSVQPQRPSQHPSNDPSITYVS